MEPNDKLYFEEIKKEVDRIRKKRKEDRTFTEDNLLVAYILMIKYIKEEQK